jgi:hypothetical protein
MPLNMPSDRLFLPRLQEFPRIFVYYMVFCDGVSV